MMLEAQRHEELSGLCSRLDLGIGDLALLGHFDRALAAFEEGYQISVDIGFKAGQAYNLLEVIQARLMMEDYEGALEKTEEHICRAREIQDRFGVIHHQRHLAILYGVREGQENREQGLKYAREAICLARQAAFLRGEAWAWHVRTQITRKMGHAAAALECSQQALDLFHQHSYNEEYRAHFLYTYFQVLQDLGRNSQASEALAESLKILQGLAEYIKNETNRQSFWRVPIRHRIIQAGKEMGLIVDQKSVGPP